MNCEPRAVCKFYTVLQFPHHAIICVSSQFRQEFPPCRSNEHKCCNMGKITQASSSTKLYDEQLHTESEFYITSVSKASTYGFISTWPTCRSWAVNLKGWGYSHIEAIIMGMCCCEGYGFQLVSSGIGFRSLTVLV